MHWGWLYLTAFIAALSHLLLDWTNNYGLRPFFPFNAHWYAGSFMFIAEPILWILFFLALTMPWLLGLADREIGARRQPFRGQGWAIFALAGMVVLGCWRWAEHAQALAMLANANIASEPVVRMAAEPYPVNPFRWHAILETADFYQTAEINTLTGSIESDPQRDVLYKPATRLRSKPPNARCLARSIWIGAHGLWCAIWARNPRPAWTLRIFRPNRTWTTVEFTDLRFDYPFIGTHSAATRSPLGGWVYIVDGWQDAGESMDGREQR